MLRARHRTEIGKDDFTILSQQDFLNTAATITNVLTIFLGGIAAISLLVGGIGIMNIMLVSVTERTTRDWTAQSPWGAPHRYPGPVSRPNRPPKHDRRAGGNRAGSVDLDDCGPRCGSEWYRPHPQIGLDTVLMATLFSTAVGLFFGLYPANRAAGLEPVEALRYE